MTNDLTENIMLRTDKWWATTVAMPGKDDLDFVWNGGEVYRSMTGWAGPKLAAPRDSAESDAGSGMWFGTTYLEMPEGTEVGFMHCKSIVSAAHLKKMLAALMEERFYYWPDQVITKTIREYPQRRSDCHSCDGTGSDEDEPQSDCGTCQGVGSYEY